MEKLAIIIINHNHGEMLQKTIQSLFNLPDKTKFQVIVVNNTPLDGVGEWLLLHYPQTEIINNQRPQGFARNANMAIQHGEPYEYYLLLNPDVICLPGMLDRLVTHMEEFADTGIVAPKLLNLDGTDQPSARHFATLPVLIIRTLHLDRLFKDSRILKGYLMIDFNLNITTEVDWVTGAIILLRKQSLNQVGLMDERFFLYFEDEDLCCRMWRKGWKVLYVPQAKAYHNHLAAGRRKPWSKMGRYHIISGLKMLWKYKFNISRTL